MSNDGLQEGKERSFTPAERQMLQEMANRQGITLPELLRKIITKALEKLPEGGEETDKVD